MRLPIKRILRPKSIAVVGVSERPEAIGTRVMSNIRKMGFAGPLYAVNPRYEKIGELKCYPALSALPEPVDAAFLAVPSHGGPDLVEEAGRCGIRALFINANGYADGDADGVALQRRVEATAAKFGIAICGPNNLGIMNVHDRVAMWSPRYMKVPKSGSLGVISQSGSIALILSEDERDLGFAYLITAGNEAVLNIADYLAELAVDDRVEVILLFSETIRDPQKFQAAALKAGERGKRIIALKLGSSSEGRALVQAHTGSLAGEDRLYDAYFKALNILRVRDLDEMLETAVLLSKDSAALPTGGNVMVTLSGGEAALIADLGTDLGLKFPELAPETLAALHPAIPPYSSIGNPLDAWGLGFAADRFSIALLADPNINLIGFSVDAPGRGGGDVPYACIMAEACVDAKTRKRLVFFNNTSGLGVNAEVRAILDRGKIPYLSGLRPALAAIAKFNALEIKSPAVPKAVALRASQPECFALLNELGIGMGQGANCAQCGICRRRCREIRLSGRNKGDRGASSAQERSGPRTPQPRQRSAGRGCLRRSLKASCQVHATQFSRRDRPAGDGAQRSGAYRRHTQRGQLRQFRDCGPRWGAGRACQPGKRAARTGR